MIEPYAAKALAPRYVADADRRSALEQEAATLPTLKVNTAAVANLVMLASGYFSPLPGFMSRADFLSIADKMHTSDGLFWPIPCVNLTATPPAALGAGDRIALCDPNLPGCPVIAIQTVSAIEEIAEPEFCGAVEKIFGTADEAHPGVSTFFNSGRFIVSGSVEVLHYSYFQKEFPETFMTAMKIREQIAQRGWETVVAFQTRNPMHLAHEELCKIAMKAVGADGLLIHMLLGRLKAGDIPASVRDAAIRKMVACYFPPGQVLVGGYGFDMLYAGPREAVLHAIFRQNAGCSHLIVGRDHAGVGKYYGAFEAQEIFQRDVPEGALQIKIFAADHTAYSKRLHRVVMMRDAPDHTADDFVLLSGTKVRDLLSQGKPLPQEFARPEVAEILMHYYQDQQAQKGAPS